MQIPLFIAGVALLYSSGCFSVKPEGLSPAPGAALITGFLGILFLAVACFLL